MANLESVITIPVDILFREVSGEAVVLNATTGRYYGLDGTATRMWQLLARHGRVAPAYDALLAEYDVAAERLHQDLLGFVDQLASHGLLQVSDA